MSTLTRKHHLSAEQVALRLGVRLPTVYAYVSRGLLTRRLSDDGRTSRYDPAEVDALSRRSRPRKGATRVGTIDVSLATSVTRIASDRLYYRTHEATHLARDASFEQVAELLWAGELPTRASLPLHDADRRAIRRLVRALPESTGPLERFAVVTATVASLVPTRSDLHPSSVLPSARRLLAAFVESLPHFPTAPVASETDADVSFAARLWPRLSPLPARPHRLRLLDAALVLTADHELATSTLAARIAASARADPFAVVLAGLGTLSGALHGRAPGRCHALLLEAAKKPSERVVALARREGNIPGFGRHPVYGGEDPRAVHLFGLLRKTARSKEMDVVERFIAAAATDEARPNVDFALGAIAYAHRMPIGATEALFTVARTAGWIAHALEEYGEEPLRFRPRATYVGRT